MTRKRIIRWLLGTAGLAVILALIAAAVVTGLLRASLPDLDGQVLATGLRASVVIERDELGVPTIAASNRLDMVFGLGFVHGQDRFFQMDWGRRFAAGELAALMGPGLVDQDKRLRRLRLRRTAAQALAALPPDQRGLAEAYTAGVNAGLTSLGSRPPEYWVLGSQPQPWRAEDTLLRVVSMSLSLSTPPLDRLDTILRRELGPAAFAFFYPLGTDWDAALDGSLIPAAPIPGPDQLDFRKGWELANPDSSARRRRWARGENTAGTERIAATGETEANPNFVPGSNAFAVDGSLSSTRAALLASDMHLDYQMPNTFYRARLKWTENGRAHDVIAVTLPGTPVAATASNGRVAWGPTNAFLDSADQILLEVDPVNPERYRGPDGWVEFEKVTEHIDVRGAKPVDLLVRWTRWGPVLEKNPDGTPFLFEGHPVVLKAVSLSPEAADLRLFDLMLAENTDEALRIGAESGGPLLNLVVGDRLGQVGWTLTGRLPRRSGQAGKQIVSWADGRNGWQGWQRAEEHPRAGSPELSRVCSANHRQLGTEHYLALATSNPLMGARAKQIRDALAGLTNATPADLLAIQLDDRALLLAKWRDLLLATLRLPRTAPKATSQFEEAVRCVLDWNGRATADSVGYRLVRGFRLAVLDSVFEPVTARVSKLAGEAIDRHLENGERPVWALLQARPAHLLSPRFATYDDLLIAALSDVVEQLRDEGQGDLSRATWGRNANRPIPHPFSQAVPALTPWLGASLQGCNGGNDMPRVNDGGGGAVERFVVSPGHEEQGLFQMPGGQSGHFLSPYYRAGHADWVHGKAGPLLPGHAQHVLKLAPGHAPGAPRPGRDAP